MYKKMKFCLVLMVFALVSGCSSIHTSDISNDHIVIQSGNFQYVKTNVMGASSKVVYFLGIGGNDTESLIHEAKVNLIKNHPLGPNQALANMTVGYKTSLQFGLWIKRHCIITADIIEFKNSKH